MAGQAMAGRYKKLDGYKEVPLAGPKREADKGFVAAEIREIVQPGPATPSSF